jgi:hypothetical protein
MLRFLTRFSTRYFLVLIIFIYIVCFVGSLIFRGRAPQELLFRLFDTLICCRLYLSSVAVSVFDASPELSARPPPRGDCLLHALPSPYPSERPALKPLGHGFVPPAGVLRRRPCGRVTGGDGRRLVGETSLLRRASVLAFSHSCASRRCAPPVALRRQPSYRHLSSVHHSCGGYSAEALRRLKDGVVVLIFPASAVHLFEAVKTSSTAFDKLDSLGDQRRREAQRISA